MNYYEHHLGDYAQATAHLSFVEDAAYSRLIRKYYAQEKPLPADLAATQRLVGARTKEEKEAVETVLSEFFELRDDGWHNKRCDEEIARYLDKQIKAKRSAKARWDPDGAQCDGNANAMRTHSEGNADGMLSSPQSPDTSPQTPLLTEEAIASLSGSPFPPCPHGQILELYKRHLPHLPQHRTWEGKRQANLRARWVQASKPSSYSPEGYTTGKDGLAWWSDFFAYIANDTKLSKGFETSGRVWVPDLEWISKAENFNKIIDGKYDI